jgi:hypothetical protein
MYIYLSGQFGLLKGQCGEIFSFDIFLKPIIIAIFVISIIPQIREDFMILGPSPASMTPTGEKVPDLYCTSTTPWINFVMACVTHIASVWR